MKIFELPESYKEIKKIDLAKNKKLAVFVNLLSLVIALVVFGIGFLWMPFNISFIDYENVWKPLAMILMILVIMMIYLILHELTHGFFFKKYSGEKANYGLHGLYAYAKSGAFFNKKEYLIIGLSPVVIFGVLCLTLNIVLGSTLFWYIYFIQIINLSGAAGDFYVIWVMQKMPYDILIKDDGVSMTIFAK